MNAQSCSVVIVQQRQPMWKRQKAYTFPVHLHMDEEEQNQRVMYLYQQLPATTVLPYANTLAFIC